MTIYHIRCHFEKEHMKALLSYFEEKGYHVMAEETGLRKHIHVCHETTLTDATVRKHLKDIGLKGNKQFSVSTLRKELYNMYSYIMKFGEYTVGSQLNKQAFEEAVKDCEIREAVKSKDPTWKLILRYLDNHMNDEPHIVGSRRDWECERAKVLILQYHLEQDIQFRRNQAQVYYDTWRLKKIYLKPDDIFRD